MECPACQQNLLETATSCSRCGFSLETCDRLFGGPPSLSPGLNDVAQRLSTLSSRRVTAALREFGQRFPQLKLSALIQPYPETGEPRTHMFWLFNRGGLANPIERGGHNRHLLLWLDPDSLRLSVMIGYGLEPFLDRERLETVLTQAMLAPGPVSSGRMLLTAIRALDHALTDLWHELPRLFGWFPEDTWWPLDETPHPERAGDLAEVLEY